jgi:hypothetical protein
MERRQHCTAKRHREVCVNLRPRPVNHPCCGSHHEPSQCKYRANYGKRITGPETVTTKNAYARRQLTRPLDATEYIESIRYLFEEEEDYVEAIRELFREEEEGAEMAEEAEEGAEGGAPIVWPIAWPIAGRPCVHNWWEAFKAGPFPKIRSKGMDKK